MNPQRYQNEYARGIKMNREILQNITRYITKRASAHNIHSKPTKRKGVIKMLNKEIPTKYKNQLNGKSLQENYREYKKQQHEEFIFSLSQKAKEDLRAEIESAIGDILNSLKMP